MANSTSTTAVATAGTTSPAQIWIPLQGQSAADVLAAVRKAPLVQLVSSTPATSDGSVDLSHLGSPVLVLAYHASNSDGREDAPDFYEIPAMTPSGVITNLIDAELNPAHTAIFVGSISGTDPTTHWPGQLIPLAQAVQIVQAERHTGLRAGEHAQLIYFAAYNTSAIEAGQLTWSAGGGGPQNPIWLIPGADGHDYFVGTDGKSYTQAQLPLARAA
jgi:hypothetical protein